MAWLRCHGPALLVTSVVVSGIPLNHEGCDNGHLCTCYGEGKVGKDCTGSCCNQDGDCTFTVGDLVNEDASRKCTNVDAVYDMLVLTENSTFYQPADPRKNNYACDMLKLDTYCRNSKKLEPGNCITDEHMARCTANKAKIPGCDVDCGGSFRCVPDFFLGVLPILALQAVMQGIRRLPD
mmetsp:Transcript_57567/g.89609  ORF Transcript_57567/g.89609 Transcript_57567/m.89609 type:complete len:180 (-) Transcript_57567:84-623(-)